MEKYLDDYCTQPMSDGESIRADFEEDDLYDMCDKCQFKWQCSSWTNKSVCGRNYAEWEDEAEKCREYRNGKG